MPAKIKYAPGTIIGNNKIIKEDIDQTKQKGRSFWICECVNCGNIRSLRSDNLNRNKLCQKCHNKNGRNIKDNLIGKTFGFLTVIDKAERPNYWICKCKCGTVKEVFRGNLIDGNTKSCGCISSWGETQIIYWLKKYNLNYKKEYIFEDLKTSKNGYPRFDFAIFNNNNELFCLIEYDGRQHFSYNKNWKMSYDDYIYLCETDNLKNQYCIDNNIKLLRFNKNTNIKFEIKKIATNIVYINLVNDIIRLEETNEI